MVIPGGRPRFATFRERVHNPIVIRRTTRDHEITFLVEAVNPGFTHSCTVGDIMFVIDELPLRHVRGIDLIVLRQPTKKQAALSSVWGCILYWANMGEFEGTAIHVEAQPLGKSSYWKTSIDPDTARELDRLRKDGHDIKHGKRSFHFLLRLQATRNTQLYRTLIHELGHYADYDESYLEALGDKDYDKALSDKYGNKPSHDKEDFAHRYAGEHFQRLKETGRFPFERIFDEEGMIADGLDPNWFLE
jgi:hypothetical protein